MANSNFDSQFQTALKHSGPPYLDARKAILNLGEPALVALEKQEAAAEWNTALTAQILIGWLQTPQLFHQCTEAVLGHLTGPVPITGSFPPPRRIAVIRKLGKSVTPRLLEMLLKSQEYGDRDQRSAIFGSLAVLHDDRAVAPLIHLLTAAADPAIRQWAASTLGPMKDPRAVAPLLNLLHDAQASHLLRAAAAMSLGQLDAKAAAPDLRQIVAGDHLDLDLRKSAARSLGDLGDPEAPDALLKAFRHAGDLAFQLVLLEAVGKTATAAALPRIKEIEANHLEPPVRDAAKEAAAQIEERSHPNGPHHQ